MKIELQEPLARGYVAHPRDVRQVKRALVCRGYYSPDPRTGINERVMNDELAALEKENGLYIWRTEDDDKERV